MSRERRLVRYEGVNGDGFFDRNEVEHAYVDASGVYVLTFRSGKSLKTKISDPTDLGRLLGLIPLNED